MMKGATVRMKMDALAAEWRAIPWNARGRRVGRTLEIVIGVTLIVFGPALVTAVVNVLVP
jgi:hypothetical protein